VGTLQTARLENFVRRWGSIKGGGSVLSETLGDVFPMLDLENLSPELQAVAGWIPYVVFGTVIGDAGDLGAIQIGNAPGSEVIATVDKVIVNTVVAQAVTWGQSTALLNVVGNVRNRDSRSPGVFSGFVTIRALTSGTLAETSGIIRTVAGVDREYEYKDALAILGPNSAFTLVESVVAESLTVTFFGRVRLAEPSELSF